MRYVLLLLAAVLAWAGDNVPVTVPAPAPTYDEVVIENQRARVVLSTRRGLLARFELASSQRIILPRHLAELVNPVPEGWLPVLRDFNPAGPAHNWLMDHDAGAGGLTAADDATPWQVTKPAPDTAVFTFEKPGRLAYALTYRLAADRPALGVELAIRNLGAAPVQLTPQVVPLNGIHQDYGPGESYYACVFKHAGGASGSISNEGMPAPDKNLVFADATGLDYLGLKSRYFAVWWSPQALPKPSAPAPVVETPAAGPAGPAGPGAVVATPAEARAAWAATAVSFQGRGRTPDSFHRDHQAYVIATGAAETVAPGATLQRGWTISVASMTKADLSLFSEAEQAIKYTDGFHRFFKLLANALTWVLDVLASVVGHYGVAVILLTILIKAALYRFTFKQQESMLKMQKVAPELKYLQEQYKNNKQMLAQKQMELWKKHGVNPLGGCLPILIQLPIFIALFQAFSHSADLRGTSFLWIPDLTLPDQVIGWPIAALGGWVLSLNPLPIIYIGVSAWMSFSMPMPANSDPQQEMMFKMMRWMPVVFGVIFYNMPSGLVLYFTVQAVISTLETKYIRRKLGIA